MVKKEEIFKVIVILMFIVFFGCGRGYLASPKGDLSKRKVVDSWRELDADVVRVYEGKVLLNIRVKDFSVVGKRLRLKEVYGYGSVDANAGGKGFLAFVGLLAGCYGCYSGYKYGLERDEDYTPSLLFPNPSDEGCQTACLWSLPGFLLIAIDRLSEDERAKVTSDFIKEDTVCVTGELLSIKKVKIAIEKSNFKKIYYTDEYGNIELGFDEIISEPIEVDSVLNFIIRYYELVDTVEVRRL